MSIKLPKDKVISVRINSHVNSFLGKEDITVQNIIDEYIEKRFKVKLEYKEKGKEPREIKGV